jgi:DNA polymerase V
MELDFFTLHSPGTNLRCLIRSPISAGHPQDADDTAETIDLNDYVSRGSRDIFYITVKGDSMIEFGINDGDLLVADRSRQPKNGDVVIAEINGSFTVKRFARWRQRLFLVPENDEYKTRRIEDHEHFAVWGVVTHVVHRF